MAFIATVTNKFTDKNSIHKFLILIATLLALITIGQVVFPIENWLPLQDNIPIATVGNPDFLATILAVGFFVLIDLDDKISHRWAIASLILIALIFTKSKGTCALTFFLLLFRIWPRFSIISAFSSILALIVFFPDKIAGRIHLWHVALTAWSQSFWFGYGFDQFGNVYFNTVKRLMINTDFKLQYAAWISEVSDAHNIFLQSAIDLGIVGFILSITLVGYSIYTLHLSTFKKNSALLLIVIKSFYTVVLYSIQGAILWAILLGLNSARKESLYLRQSIALPFSLFLGLLLPTQIIFLKSDHFLFEATQYLRVALFEQAREPILNGLEINPKNSDLLLAKAFYESETDQCLPAKNTVYKTLDFKQSIDTYKRGGHILFRCRFYDDAKIIFQTLHHVLPEHRTTMIKLAWIAYYQKKYTLAQKWAKNVITINPRRSSYSDSKNLKEANRILELTKLSPSM